MACAKKEVDVNRTVYVGNIGSSSKTSADALSNFLSKYGNVENVSLVKRPGRQFAFVTYEEKTSAVDVVKAAKSRSGIHYLRRRLYIAPKHGRSKAATENEKISGECWFNVLPIECLVQILGYLPIVDRLICQNVCVRWRQACYTLWSSTKKIDFDDDCFINVHHSQRQKILRQTSDALISLNLGRSCGKRFVKQLLDLVSSKIQTFTIPPCYVQHWESAVAMKRTLPNVTTLHLSGTQWSTEKLLKLRGIFPSFNELYINGVSGYSVDLTLLKNIRKLHYVDPSFDTLEWLADLFKPENNYVELDLTVYTHTFRPLTVDCPHLKKLALRQSASLDEVNVPTDSDSPLIDFSGAPLLEELVLQKFLTYLVNGTSTMQNLVNSCFHLRKLTLRGFRERYYTRNVDGYERFWQILAKLKNLTILDVNYSHMVNVEEQAINLKSLEELHMRDSGGVLTFDRVVYLIDELPKLQLLDISGRSILTANSSGNGENVFHDDENSLTNTEDGELEGAKRDVSTAGSAGDQLNRQAAVHDGVEESGQIGDTIEGEGAHTVDRGRDQNSLSDVTTGGNSEENRRLILEMEQKDEMTIRKEICERCVDENIRPTMELVMAGSGFFTRQRWRCGRFIICNQTRDTKDDQYSISTDEDELDWMDDLYDPGLDDDFLYDLEPSDEYSDEFDEYPDEFDEFFF